jgi:hypothetical protein
VKAFVAERDDGLVPVELSKLVKLARLADIFAIGARDGVAGPQGSFELLADFLITQGC